MLTALRHKLTADRQKLNAPVLRIFKYPWLSLTEGLQQRPLRLLQTYTIRAARKARRAHMMQQVFQLFQQDSLSQGRRSLQGAGGRPLNVRLRR